MGLTPAERIKVCVSLARILPMAAGAFADALDDMLNCAQEWYGLRDRDCMVTGIRFEGKYPKVAFPQRPAKLACVRLSDGAFRWAKHGDLHYAFWQLAHEAVHLLSPTPGQRVSILEEGLACCFQYDYMCGYPEFNVPSQYMPSYIQAQALVRALLTLDRDVIKKARQSEPIIAQINAEILITYCPQLPLEVARSLTARFYRDRVFSTE